MQVVATFDPTSATSDDFNTNFSKNQGRIVVWNESPVNLYLSWGSNNKAYVGAWTARLFRIVASSVLVTWTQQSVLNTSGSPASQVVVEAYQDSEQILGTFPASLVRQTNVGNSITVNSGGLTVAQELQNDSSPLATTIIESTPSGESGSFLLAKNDGTFQIYAFSNNVKTLLFDVFAGGPSSSAEITLPTVLGDTPDASGYTTRFGIGLHGTTDVGIESVAYTVIGGQSGLILKQNNYYNGTNHLFVAANPAYQFDMGGSLSGIGGSVSVRTNTNSPSAGGVITWGAWTAIDFGLNPVVTNGRSAGSVTVYQWMRGPVKMTMIVMQGYEAGASAQKVALPSPYTFAASIRTGRIGTSGNGGMSLLSSNVAQTINVVTALATGGGSTTGETVIYQHSIGECPVGFDTLEFLANTSSAKNCITLIEGT